jgi:hypothetical protein
LLDAQRVVQSVIESGVGVIAAEPVGSLGYFADLRSASALILRGAEVDDLGCLPQVAADAFLRYVADREELSQRRQKIPPSRRRRGGSPRQRPYTSVPKEAALMAALLPAATELLAAPSANALSESMAPLVERVWARQGRSPRKLPEELHFSPRLRQAFELMMLPRTTVHLRLRHYLGDRSEVLLDDRHVPQLLWASAFDEWFADLFPGVDRDFARRYCAMALVWMVRPRPWEEAASALGLPQQAVNGAFAYAGSLRSRQLESTFAERLKSVAEWAQRQPPVDYAVRRLALAGLDGISEDDWRRICASAGVGRGKPARRRYAAIWLWCEVTGGDYRLAPAMSAWRAERSRATVGNPLTMYRRYIRDDPFRAIGASLIEYGLHLVETRAASLRSA